jgi:hypothetical protein
MKVELIIVVLSVLALIVGVTFDTIDNSNSGDWIASRVESGQDRHGNCYLYVKPWQWMERVDCSKIGK